MECIGYTKHHSDVTDFQNLLFKKISVEHLEYRKGDIKSLIKIELYDDISILSRNDFINDDGILEFVSDHTTEKNINDIKYYRDVRIKLNDIKWQITFRDYFYQIFEPHTCSYGIIMDYARITEYGSFLNIISTDNLRNFADMLDYLHQSERIESNTLDVSHCCCF
jgi:hypothetical protein